MPRLFTLLLILGFFTICSHAKHQNFVQKKVNLPEQELHQLDNALHNAGRYNATKMNHIDSLQSVIAKINRTDTHRKWQLATEIGDQFKVFSADSALNYYIDAMKIAKKANNSDLMIRSHAAIVGALSAAGIFSEAITHLDSLEKILPTLQTPLKIEIYKSGRQLYSYMCAYIDSHQHFYDLYHAKSMYYSIKLLELLPESDPFARFLKAEQLINEGRYNDAKHVLEKLLADMPDYSNLYGMSAYQMAEVFRNQGDETEAARFMTLAAISDIKGSVREGLALPSLAKLLYEQGDVDRAFNYINSSLEDAMEGNARMRTVAIARFVPLIDNAYRQKISSSRDELMVYFLLVTCLLIVSGFLFFFLIRQMRRLKTAKEKISATSKLQDAYIGNFLGMCSNYALRLDSMNKLVTRKIASGQIDELLKMMKSGKFAEEQTDDFMKIFDSAFLDLYPNFVDGINYLLREDESIVIKKGQGLPTELRIYAFVRLGVDESTKISQILHCSVSTVYTYRNKMRNKAIDRENFEKNVMEIGRN